MDKIKIKVAKDYLLTKMIYESDCRSARSGINKTYLSEYGGLLGIRRSHFTNVTRIYFKWICNQN